MNEEPIECRKCGIVKPVTEFYKRGGKLTGYRFSCKQCLAEISAAKMPEYHVWTSMRNRCNNPNHKAYKNYGGRGITVCKRWESFDMFIKDVGPRPTVKHQIDRRDNNGNYEPGNCRWATSTENQRNRRNNILTMEKARDIRSLRAKGMLQREIAEIYGCSRYVIKEVLAGRNWKEKQCQPTA